MQDKIIVDLLKNDLNDINALLSEYLFKKEERKSRIFLIETKLEAIKKEFELLKNNINNSTNLTADTIKKVAVEKPINTIDNNIDNKQEQAVNTKKVSTEAPRQRIIPTVSCTEKKQDVNTEKARTIIAGKVLSSRNIQTNNDGAGLTKTENRNNTLDTKNNIIEDKLLLNDRVTASSNALLADKITSKSVSNIKNLIGINDRFLFIRELFNSEVNDYNTTIEYVNNCSSFAEAYNGLSSKYSWDLENDVVIDFINICKRKF